MNLSSRLIAQMQSFSSRRKRSHTMSRVCALIVLTLAQLLWATRAPAQVTHTIVAATGDAAPAGGNFVSFFQTRVLNVRGQVAFDASLSGPSRSGVFVSDGRTMSVIALGGDPNPAAGNFGFVSIPSI